MAARPKSICRKAACGRAIESPGYCERHQKEAVGWYATSKGSNTERGYGWKWKQLRDQVMRRDHYLCQSCLKQGRIKEATEVDHQIPKAKGGTDDEANLSAICRECHSQKTALDRKK